MASLNHTHDPAARSWVQSANDPASDFPIQNLPYCAFTTKKSHGASASANADANANASIIGTAGCVIGDHVLDLTQAAHLGLLPTLANSNQPVRAITRISLSSLSAPQRAQLRLELFDLLSDKASTQTQDTAKQALHALRDVQLLKPAVMRNYTDFYASIHHATTVGAMFRPDNPLLPNYKHIPIGYHGRASSIIVSGEQVRRPSGQQSPPDADPAAGPSFGPCKLLDYELEVGCVIAQGNQLGTTIPLNQANDHILGLCIVNDWSARDLQKWEYQPLGPFLAKNFATSVSPFLITPEALEPFRCPGSPRPASDPKPLPYLQDPTDTARGGFDLHLEVSLRSAKMIAANLPPMRISHGRSFKEMYWTFAQMITHHTCNGCNFESGDLIASGTVSGPDPDSRGCLLELTWAGAGQPRKQLQLPTGETRTFLADGDEVTIKVSAQREGFRTIGFGECVGRIVGQTAR